MTEHDPDFPDVDPATGDEAETEPEVALTVDEQAMIALTVWPVDPQPDPGLRDLHTRVTDLVERIVAGRVDQGAP